MKTKKKCDDYHKDLISDLKDPDFALEYLKASLEEDDVPEVFLLALRNVVEANSFSKLSKRTKLNRENLYKMLSNKGNPEFYSLCSILKALKLKLSVDHLDKAYPR